MSSNIWVAAADNRIDLVKRYVESKQFTANSKDINGYTPIHAATSYGHLDLLDYLISKGGDINIQDSEGDSPLHHVEEVEVAKYLVEKLGANYKLKNNDDQTPLQYIEEDDDFPEVIDYLRSLETESMGTMPVSELQDSLPKDGEIVDGHEIRYSYQSPPANEINLTAGLTQEEREAKLKAIAESDNPEELLKELVKNAVHQHMTNREDNAAEEEIPSQKKRKN